MTAAPVVDRRLVAPDAPKFNHLRVAAEFAVAFAILLAIDDRWFGGSRFAAIDPHPYWLVVVLAAAVYGSGTGFIVAATASLLWLTGVHAAFHDGEDYFTYIFGRTLLPLLWLSVALMLGELVSARQRRMASVIAQARDLSRQADALTEKYRALAGLNRDLQIAITTSDRTTSHVLDIAAQLAAPQPAEFGATLAAMIATASGDASFVLYLLDRGELVPVLSGADGGTEPPVLLGSALHTAVVREGNLVHAADPRGLQLLAGAGMLALPVRHGRDGDGVGLVLFRALPIEAFTDMRLSEISALSGWVSEIVGHRLSLLVTSTVTPASFLSVVAPLAAAS